MQRNECVCSYYSLLFIIERYPVSIDRHQTILEQTYARALYKWNHFN